MNYNKNQLVDISFNDKLDLLGEKTNSYLRRSAVYEDICLLQFEHKVGINSLQNGGWEAYHPPTDIYYEDNDPLNAIICCLILVLQEQQL